MRRYRLSRPNGTHFACGVVTNGEDEIHLGRIAAREFVPALGAQTLCRKIQTLEQRQREWMDCAFGETAGGESPEASVAFMVQDRLGQNRTRRIARAEKKHVVGAGHGCSTSAAAATRRSL